MDSILINSEITKSLASQLLHSPQTTPLPDLHPLTAPELEYRKTKSAGAHTFLFIIITIFMALLPRLPNGHTHLTSHS